MLDKILEYIPSPGSPGRRTLAACALVATWWVGPSQRRLFYSVALNEENYRRWMLGVIVPTPKLHLLKHTRSLWHARAGLNPKFKHRMRHLPQDSGRYLSTLCNLQDLTMYNTKVERISEEGFRLCFSAFRETLTQFSLEHSATSFGSLVTLVDYFPNIRSLRLLSLILEPDKGSVPTLSRPLRGKIHIGHVDRFEFYRRFSDLDPEYEELVIDPLEMMFLESALQISASTVKYLRLPAPPSSEYLLPTPIRTTSSHRLPTFKVKLDR